MPSKWVVFGVCDGEPNRKNSYTYFGMWGVHSGGQTIRGGKLEYSDHRLQISVNAVARLKLDCSAGQLLVKNVNSNASIVIDVPKNVSLTPHINMHGARASVNVKPIPTSLF
eukprot:TRINITY_DN5574_c0_g2_i4.p1 TRINITY_DN5574_c0_g2~~TRINITY_DN5574_c0_g2_i4.p1  ORF type:complete len:112 (+),score=21.20 TRINITY_DN5574_c0_g2_i4:926-1261(+)